LLALTAIVGKQFHRHARTNGGQSYAPWRQLLLPRKQITRCLHSS